MCGIVGMFGTDITNTDLDVLKQLSQVSIVRGEHGTGIIQGRFDRVKGKDVTLYDIDKSERNINDFLKFHKHNNKGNNKLFNDIWDEFFIVHVRWATKGALTAKNAHPFDFYNIMGVHNGTLNSADFKPVGDGTDSEEMFRAMDEKGMYNVLKDLRKDSAFAIIAVDKNRRVIQIARNEHRPLTGAWHKYRKVFYVASEKEMMEWVFKRNNIFIDKYVDFTPDMLVEFTPDDINAGRRPDWKVRKIDASKPEQVCLPRPNTANTSITTTSDSQSKKETKTYSQANEKKEKEVNRNNDAPFLSTSKQESRPRLSYYKTCIACAKSMAPIDQFLGSQLSYGAYLCKDCQDLEGDLEQQYWESRATHPGPRELLM